MVAVLVLAGLQAAFLLLWRARSPGEPTPSRPAFEVLGGTPAPSLQVERRGGAVAAIDPADGRPRLIHFWASWCPPCTGELPDLIAFGRELEREGIQLVAVAVDDTWPAIERFLAGEVSAAVVREVDAVQHRRFGTDTLPDTYLVDGGGALIRRYQGARDWSDGAVRASVRDALARPR
jgi:thiol-disulfide isomerase/thioredoxin